MDKNDEKLNEELVEKFRKVYNLLTEDVDYSGTDTIKYNYESYQFIKLRNMLELEEYINDGDSEFDIAVKIILAFYDHLKPINDKAYYGRDTNTIALLKKILNEDNNGLSSFDLAKIYCDMFLSLKIKARRVIFEPFKERDVPDYSLVEIFDTAKDKWILLDTCNCCYYTDSDGMPLSVYEMRHTISNNIIIITKSMDGWQSTEFTSSDYIKFKKMLNSFAYDKYMDYYSQKIFLYLAPKKLCDKQKDSIINLFEPVLRLRLKRIDEEFRVLKQEEYTGNHKFLEELSMLEVMKPTTIEDILKCTDIQEIYKKIEQNKSLWSDHGMRHITKVIENIEKIAKIYEISPFELELCKMAGLLHDVGIIQGKENHSLLSANIATKILFEHTNYLRPQICIVSGAISDHSQVDKKSPLLTKILVLADKCDITKERVTEEGSKHEGLRQHGNIDSVDIVLDDNKLVVELTVNDKFDELEFAKFYFTKTLHDALISLAENEDYGYDIRANGKSIIKLIEDNY